MFELCRQLGITLTPWWGPPHYIDIFKGVGENISGIGGYPVAANILINYSILVWGV